jgi:hypothetical protein
MSDTRYRDFELFDLEQRIYDLNLPFGTNNDVIVKFVCDEIKRELYYNKDRMDSYRFWDEMKSYITEQEVKLQERLDKLNEK